MPGALTGLATHSKGYKRELKCLAGSDLSPILQQSSIILIRSKIKLRSVFFLVSPPAIFFLSLKMNKFYFLPVFSSRTVPGHFRLRLKNRLIWLLVTLALIGFFLVNPFVRSGVGTINHSLVSIDYLSYLYNDISIRVPMSRLVK